MAYITHHGRLWLYCFPSNAPQGVGYFYTVLENGTMAHTAFRTRKALMRWMELRGITPEEEVPEPGPPGSPVKGIRLIGSYRKAMYLHDANEFHKLRGIETRVLSNAQYTRAIITTDEDGIRTVHFLNPNVRDRVKYDYDESRKLEDEGLL